MTPGLKWLLIAWGIVTGILITLLIYRSTLTMKEDLQLSASYCSLAYSALASFRMGMSGSESFQRAKKSW